MNKKNNQIKYNKINIYKKIAISFFVISAVIAVCIFYLTFSWANIVIVPRPEAITNSYLIEVSDGSSQNANQQVIKGKVIERTIETEGKFSTQTSVQEKNRATGKITLINKQPKAQQLIATTRLMSSDNVLFRIKDSVLIPANGQIDVDVYADVAGEIPGLSGNKFILPALHESMQSLVYGQGFIPTSTGVGSVKVISQADIDAAVEKLVKQTEEKFKLESDNADLGFKPSKLLQVSTSKILSQKADKKVGDKSDDFTVKVKVNYKTVLFDEADVLKIVSQKFKETLATNQELIAPNPNDIQYDYENYNANYKSATIKVTATANKIVNQDANVFNKDQLSNLSADQIKQYFKSYDEIADVQVRFYPFWVTTTPTLIDHINIMIKK